MVHCRGCGQVIHETAPACPHCGAPQGISNLGIQELPDGIKGWSWGAFLLSWVWGIGNGTWIALLALVPYLGFIVAIVLGFKGREWAWKNKRWDSVEHFNRVQRSWSVWGVAIIAGSMIVGILAAIALPAYQDYSKRAAARRNADAAIMPQPAEVAPRQAIRSVPEQDPSATPEVSIATLRPAPAAEEQSSAVTPVAALCTTNMECVSTMLSASNPRDAQILSAAAQVLLQLPGPVSGDRKTSRELNTTALSEFSNGNFTEAAVHFEQAVVADPHDVEIRSNLGLTYVKLGRPQEAIESLAVALQIAPRRATAWAPLAEALDLANKPSQAYEALLLTYEFSGNKEKTKDFFQSRFEASDVTSSMRTAYANALSTIQSGY